ncbi:methylmalonyl-CoA mutase [bacterium]|nr:methylmalonyl-CoA mutase [bacterium]
MAGKTTEAERERWEEEFARAPVRPTVTFDSISGEKIKGLYSPEDLAEFDPEESLGYPGQYPFTRGVHPNMYRGRLWTMRQFAGFGTAEDTNERYRFLFSKGQRDLSVAFDLPTLMGVDSDDARAIGEVGRLGVAVDTIDDMERIFEGLDLNQVSTSMTINAPAAIVLAFYFVVAERQGVPWERVRGTCQNDILKEFHAQNEFVFPPAESVRLVTDTIEFCANHAPKFNPVSISGYHIREAGANAIEELAFTLADGFEYVEQSLARGLSIDEFAPRLSFFFIAHNDFFEEIAKYRAARRIWAKRMRDRYGAKSEASMKLRFHAQTAGSALQAQQPHVNLMRVSYQAMAAVLGGCQSLHTNSMDETLALPSEHAVTLALRTQQVLAFETGAANTVDPLGGSYFIESLTDRMEEAAESIFEHIDKLGGVMKAIETGYFRRVIADSAYRYQREVDRKERIIVGVNDFIDDSAPSVDILKVDLATEHMQVERLKQRKAERNSERLNQCLERVRQAAANGENVMPALIEATRERASVGELTNALADVFGRYPGVPGG